VYATNFTSSIQNVQVSISLPYSWLLKKIIGSDLNAKIYKITVCEFDPTLAAAVRVHA
jgi:hypothetical protein